MSIERRTFLGSGLALLAAGAASAQDAPTPFATDPAAPFWPSRERFPLWPGTPPGAPRARIVPNWTMNVPAPNRELWIRGVPFPEVHVFRAAKPDGSALLSLPGGGYEFLSVQNEGIDVAERFNAERTTVFVLTYRLPGEGWANRGLVAIQDAQRAMRLIRSRAREFRIDPHRLGVIGFSAGGHLAADLGVSYDQPLYKPIDAADRLSARPAYLGLVYPVVTLTDAPSHYDATKMLWPAPPSQADIDARSPVLHITRDTPPAFLVHGSMDGTVPVWHSFRWAGTCWNAGVPAELHVFSETGHGFGLHIPKDQSGSRWPDLFALWMRKHGA
ncbi:alpha/beta hydrolase [Sphingomonas sp.]|uniref:alpha/beta hydrolase n=1 Tax=Sphingomonas sp. TaxID=28214 RepID=UPI0025F6C8F9|nr:alpha/beta hydrolase [Sphingomonas sp.]MBV9527374.1 alpha/beta hydrolase [Sphingomonas sp.]